jgi:hypothetical protein
MTERGWWMGRMGLHLHNDTIDDFITPAALRNLHFLRKLQYTTNLQLSYLLTGEDSQINYLDENIRSIQSVALPRCLALAPQLVRVVKCKLIDGFLSADALDAYMTGRFDEQLCQSRQVRMFPLDAQVRSWNVELCRLNLHMIRQLPSLRTLSLSSNGSQIHSVGDVPIYWLALWIHHRNLQVLHFSHQDADEWFEDDDRNEDMRLSPQVGLGINVAHVLDKGVLRFPRLHRFAASWWFFFFVCNPRTVLSVSFPVLRHLDIRYSSGHRYYYDYEPCFTNPPGRDVLTCWLNAILAHPTLETVHIGFPKIGSSRWIGTIVEQLSLSNPVLRRLSLYVPNAYGYTPNAAVKHFPECGYVNTLQCWSERIRPRMQANLVHWKRLFPKLEELETIHSFEEADFKVSGRVSTICFHPDNSYSFQQKDHRWKEEEEDELESFVQEPLCSLDSNEARDFLGALHVHTRFRM